MATDEQKKKLAALAGDDEGNEAAASEAPSPAQPSAPLPPESIRCKGVTGKGVRCRKFAVAGSAFCEYHKPREEDGYIDTSSPDDSEATALLKQGASGVPLVNPALSTLWSDALEKPLVVVKTYDDVMQVLSATLQLTFLNVIDKTKADAVVNLCKAMLSALDANKGQSIGAKLRIKLGIGPDGSEERTLEFEGVEPAAVAAYQAAVLKS